jgi:hypothetical protein
MCILVCVYTCLCLLAYSYTYILTIIHTHHDCRMWMYMESSQTSQRWRTQHSSKTTVKVCTRCARLLSNYICLCSGCAWPDGQTVTYMGECILSCVNILCGLLVHALREVFTCVRVYLCKPAQAFLYSVFMPGQAYRCASRACMCICRMCIWMRARHVEACIYISSFFPLFMQMAVQTRARTHAHTHVCSLHVHICRKHVRMETSISASLPYIRAEQNRTRQVRFGYIWAYVYQYIHLQTRAYMHP